MVSESQTRGYWILDDDEVVDEREIRNYQFVVEQCLQKSSALSFNF